MNSLTNKEPRRSRKPPLDLCPICGSQKISIWEWEGAEQEPKAFQAQCDECGKSTQCLKEREQAIESWNNLE